MKKILLCILFLISYSCVNISYASQFPRISLQQFSDLLKNKSCIDSSELLESKYGITFNNFSNIKLLRSDKFKGNCYHVGNISKAKKLSDIVKVVSYTFMGDTHFFLFKKHKKSYLYLLKISTFLKYDIAVIRSYNFPSETIYSTDGYADGGTGLKDSDLVFFRPLKNRKSSEIFSISKEGYIFGWGSSFNRSYRSEISKNLLHKNILKINYIISYSLNRPYDEESPHLFSIRKTLLLKYDNHSFSLSDKSPNSFEEINDIMGHGEEYFCENYNHHLILLNTSKDRNIIRWSKKMQDLCKPKKKTITRTVTYTIQIGAFKSGANVEKLSSRIRMLLPNENVYSSKGGGKNNYWIVSMGQFNSLEAANAYKLALMNKYKNMTFLVRESP